jgi:hypothetical protein
VQDERDDDPTPFSPRAPSSSPLVATDHTHAQQDHCECIPLTRECMRRIDYLDGDIREARAAIQELSEVNIVMREYLGSAINTMHNMESHLGALSSDNGLAGQVAEMREEMASYATSAQTVIAAHTRTANALHMTDRLASSTARAEASAPTGPDTPAPSRHAQPRTPGLLTPFPPTRNDRRPQQPSFGPAATPGDRTSPATSRVYVVGAAGEYGGLILDREAVAYDDAEHDRRFWAKRDSFKGDDYVFDGSVEANISTWIRNIQLIQQLNMWPGASIKAILPTLVSGTGRTLHTEVLLQLGTGAFVEDVFAEMKRRHESDAWRDHRARQRRQMHYPDSVLTSSRERRPRDFFRLFVEACIDLDAEMSTSSFYLELCEKLGADVRIEFKRMIGQDSNRPLHELSEAFERACNMAHDASEATRSTLRNTERRDHAATRTSFASSATRYNSSRSSTSSSTSPSAPATPRATTTDLRAPTSARSVTFAPTPARSTPSSLSPRPPFGSSSSDGVKCYGCGQLGHFARDCPSRTRARATIAGFQHAIEKDELDYGQLQDQLDALQELINEGRQGSDKDDETHLNDSHQEQLLDDELAACAGALCLHSDHEAEDEDLYARH